jgi:hypothetical protein
LSKLGSDTSKKENKFIFLPGAEKLYDDNNWFLIKITDPKACSFYAKGTNWCTRNQETASHYLEEGPLYIIYKEGKIYAQLHIPTGQLKDSNDVEIPKMEIPEDLKEIIKKTIVNIENRKKAFSIFEMREKVISYQNGESWETSDFETFLLIKNNKILVKAITRNDTLIQVETSEVTDVTDSFYGRSNKTNWMDLINIAKATASNKNDYIVDLIIKEKDAIKKINFQMSDKWSLGFLTESQREKLFNSRPDLKPKIFLKTNNGFWTIDDYYYILLDKKFTCILTMNIASDGDGNYIKYGTWIKNWLMDDIDKSSFSKSTVEFIFHTQCVRIANYQINLINKWKFNDLNKEDQEKVLEKYPHFDNYINYHEKKALNINDFIKRIKKEEFDANNLDVFDNENVILNNRKYVSGENLLKKPLKINREFDDKLKKIIKEKIYNSYSSFENLKKGNYPFISDKIKEIINSKDKDSYMYKKSLSAAIAKNLFPEIIKIIFDNIKNFSNENFQLAIKDDKLVAKTPLNIFNNNIKNKGFEEFNKEFNLWWNSIDVNWEDVLEKVKKLPILINDKDFLSGIESYDAYRKLPDYFENL